MKTPYAILLIIAIGFTIYFSSLFNQFVLDDFEMIVNNQVIHSLNNFPKFLFGGVFSRGETERLTDIYYRPIQKNTPWEEII